MCDHSSEPLGAAVRRGLAMHPAPAEGPAAPALLAVPAQNAAARPQRPARSPRAPRWYVVQVPTGSEAKLIRAIERHAPAGVLDELFSPRYAAQKKVRGVWRDVEAPLFPGYLIAVTSRPAELKEALRGVPEFTRLLATGETFTPLTPEDQQWIGAFTSKGARTVPMSFAEVDEGDRVVVLEGPLVGREALIKGVNRHKGLAFLEFQICGRTVTTKVGLGIVRKRKHANEPEPGDKR